MDLQSGALFNPLTGSQGSLTEEHENEEDIFPLTGVPARLLERILTKLNDAEYLSMQQTCKDVYELAQTSRNIQVFVDDRSTNGLRWREEDGRLVLVVESEDEEEEEDNDDGDENVEEEHKELEHSTPPLVEIPYGLRFKWFHIPHGLDQKQFSQYCQLLEKYHITAERLLFNAFNYKDRTYSYAEYSKEQYATISLILKPRHVWLSIYDSDRYEGCLEWNHVEKLHAHVSTDEALQITRKLIYSLQKVKLDTRKDKWSTESFCSFLGSVLEILRYETLPNLQYFKFNGQWHASSPAVEEALFIKEELSDFNPTFVHAKWDICLDFSIGKDKPHCLVFLSQDTVSITFEKASMDCQDAFNLTGLPSNLLERIISKLECSGYARIQQTCKSLYKLVRTSKKIHVGFTEHKTFEGGIDAHGQLNLRLSETVYGLPPCRSYNCADRKELKLTVHPETLYGFRFLGLPFRYDHDEKKITVFRKIMTKYRITVKHLWLDGKSKGQCKMLVNILKPAEISVHVYGSDLYEACLGSKYVKRIEAKVNKGETLEVMKKMITGIQANPEIVMQIRDVSYPEEFYPFITSALQILRSEASPIIDFTLLGCLKRNKENPLKNDLEKLRHLHPIERARGYFKFPNNENGPNGELHLTNGSFRLLGGFAEVLE